MRRLSLAAAGVFVALAAASCSGSSSSPDSAAQVSAIAAAMGATVTASSPPPAAARPVQLTEADRQACTIAAVPLMHVYQTAAIPVLGAWSSDQQAEMAAAIGTYVQLAGDVAPTIDPLESKLAAQWIAVSVAIKNGDNRPVEADTDLWGDLKALGDACGVQP